MNAIFLPILLLLEPSCPVRRLWRRCARSVCLQYRREQAILANFLHRGSARVWHPGHGRLDGAPCLRLHRPLGRSAPRGGYRMPTFRLVLVALVSSLSTLVLMASCDIARTSLSTPTPPAAVQEQATPAGTLVQPPTVAAQPPTVAAQPTTAAQVPSPAAPIAQAPSPAARQPVSQIDRASGSVAAVPAAPVAQAAPSSQGGNPYDTVIQVYRDSRPS